MKKYSKLLFNPIDISSLIFFRIAFGVIMLWEMVRYFKRGWIRSYFISPDFYFTYPGFHWLHPLDGNNMYLVFFSLGILAFCITFGLFYRLTMPMFFLGFTYIFLLDKSNYLNHFYLISLISFLMIFLPANKSLSIDVKLWPEIKTDFVPVWTTGILVFLISVAYFFAGVAKINPDWLQGQPMHMWLLRNNDFPVVGPLFEKEWVAYFFSYSGLLLDLLMVPALLWKPTRTIAYIAICMFHVMNHFLWSIGIFPWFMIAATTLYFKPDWFRNALQRISFLPLQFSKISKKSQKAFPYSKAVVSFVFIFGFIQLMMPLRHWLYKGNVSWNEKGHRYSWHMKLRDKSARADFYVKDLKNGTVWDIDNEDYLSRRQRRKMATRPDMILQFAHHLGREFKATGHPNVGVYANIRAKLNGRKYQDLIDSNVDLLEINSFTKSEKYIVPLKTPLKN